MKTVQTKSEVSAAVVKWKSEQQRIGFVPTMGALHQGHISLINRSVAENDKTVVSIFVNPTQFNDPNDLKNYPRNLENDLALLASTGCDLIFSPSVIEMYPQPDTRQFNFGLIEQVMEGAHRPGHFNGVAQVVSKLFDIVLPHKAYFGEKDFQQLAIIKNMVQQLNYNIDIVPCAIVREVDGLAMSSRNALLTPEQRTLAVQISKTLFEAQKKVGTLSVNDLKLWVINTLNKIDGFETDYFDIVDDLSLQPIANWNHPAPVHGCVAVKVGRIRLIDNVPLNVNGL